MATCWSLSEKKREKVHNMGEGSIIIVGAGLAGLSTGCYAQMNGYDSHIFEHHSQPGGLAAAWRRGQYLIDGGIHFLIAHKPGSSIYDVYRELGAVQETKCVDMDTYIRFIDERTGLRVDFTQDLDKLAEDLRRASPQDAKAIDSFIGEARKLRDSPLLLDLGMGEPPELKSRLGSLREMWAMRGFMKYLVGKYSKSAAEFAQTMHSPFMKAMFENLFGPDGPVWFVIMIMATVAAGQLGLIDGGCPAFVLPIEKRYKALGGEMSYSSTVKEILVENDKAVGVRLEDGTEHRADVVVSAADGYSTIFKMLGGRYTNDLIRKQYSNWRMYSPTVMMSYGVRRGFPDDPPLNMFVLKRPLKIGSRGIGCMPLRVFNYSDKFAPPGKTVIQVMVETDWEYWAGLVKNRSEYDAEKERIRADVLTRLEEHYPGLESQVEVTDVATPHTTWRYTLNREGSPMGWLMTAKTLMTEVPRSLLGLRDFYMAGQWVLPGGGVPSCIYSGRHVVQILCHKNGRAFRTSLP